MTEDTLNGMKDKVIDHIDSSNDNEFVVIHFKDGSIWLITAEKWNCSGAILKHKISWSLIKQ